MNKNLDIYGACQHKMTFCLFYLSTDDPVNRFNGYTVKQTLNLRV